MPVPVSIKPIPEQRINERASYGPFDIKQYIQAPDGAVLRFSAELKEGGALPKGMICTEDGLLTGIPAKGTEGNYQVVISAENADGAVTAEFRLNIKPSYAGEDSLYIDKLKAQVWAALDQNLPSPELSDLLNRPISDVEIYYLMERWGMLRIWDAFNLEPPGEMKLLKLEGSSEYYNIYDCGSCLIGAPKDLFSHERTLEDALQTARVMAREVYERNWTVELIGFPKMTRAAWIEIQKIGHQKGRDLEVINYDATPDDLKLYHRVEPSQLAPE